MSKLVAGETQDHQTMGVLALQAVELAEVPGGGASERRHILDQHHASPEHVEIHRVSLQRGGPQVVERLGDMRHLRTSRFHTGGRQDLGAPKPLCPPPGCGTERQADQWGWKAAFRGVRSPETRSTADMRYSV